MVCHSRSVCRHGKTVPEYFHVMHAAIFMLVPTPTCNAICAGSFNVPAEICVFFSIRDVVQVTSNFHECERAKRRGSISALLCRVCTRLCCEKA